MLWLSYEYSGDDAYRKAALRTVNSFQERLRSSIVLDHHDIGFLYSLSAKACWIIVRDEEARQLALRAADKLMLRYREKGGYIQAWGQEGHETNGGRIIIDCLMNLPLLYWAYEQTGNIDYLNVAVTQADKSRRYLVRGDRHGAFTASHYPIVIQEIATIWILPEGGLVIFLTIYPKIRLLIGTSMCRSRRILTGTAPHQPSHALACWS